MEWQAVRTKDWTGPIRYQLTTEAGSTPVFPQMFAPEDPLRSSFA